jgi:carboxyl-terminal processing protease
MKMKKTSIYTIVFFSVILQIIFSCHKKDEPLTYHQQELYFINKSIYDSMNIYYLWYKNIPKGIDFKQEPDIFFESLKYKTLDKWSFLTSKADFYSGFVQGGIYGSHGIGVINDGNNQLRIGLIFPNTTAYKAGVRRGWIILKANNIVATADNFANILGPREIGNADTFLFKHDTITETKILYNENFTAPTVIKVDTVHAGSAIVGYLMFNEFRGSDSESELDSAFKFFNSVNITELVLDMRYNPGGFNTTAHYLGNLIAGKMFPGEDFVKYVYNDILAPYANETVKLLSEANSINNLPNKRIYIITTVESASCSELIIDCLKPFLSVYTVGSTTHGKPVGMIVFDLKYYDYIMAPIAFSIYNKNNEGGYYNGIAPTFSAVDDITHDFGDPKETCFGSILGHIQTGAFSMKSAVDFYPAKLKFDYPAPHKMAIRKIITVE